MLEGSDPKKEVTFIVMVSSKYNEFILYSSIPENTASVQLPSEK